MKNHHPSLVSNSNLIAWFFITNNQRQNVYFLQISLWFWKQCTRLGLGPLRRAVTVQKALQGSETKELHEETKESNDFLDEGSLTSSQIIEYSKWSQQEKNELVASPATTGARLYSLVLALCLPADKNQKKVKRFYVNQLTRLRREWQDPQSKLMSTSVFFGSLKSEWKSLSIFFL